MKKHITQIGVGFLGTLAVLYGVVSFNRFVLGSLPIWLRMIAMLTLYLLIAVVPFVLMRMSGDKLRDYGFRREAPARQCLIGLALGLAMAAVLVLPWYLLGHGDAWDNGHHYTHGWQFVYEFFYCILGVGLTEEFIFRGFFYRKFQQCRDSDWFAIFCSSALFGLFHLFSGSLLQVLLTTAIGVLFCVLRRYIKGCTTLSLVIAHGVYDAMITVFASTLL